MDDPQYKTAMQASLNGFPLRNKAWTRRPGFIFMGNSRRGQKARIMTFAFSQSNPFEIEFTAGFARFYSATGAVFTPDVVPLVSISTANPAVVTVAAVPSTWNNGDEIQFNFTLPLSADILSGRRFIIASKTATTFTIS
ncbi:MAG: hypothetical protein KGJ13_12975, partial [Patescibacteria group bacterium]|nr:hypothetical protein [Patescibacteria group bacterium]